MCLCEGNGNSAQFISLGLTPVVLYQRLPQNVSKMSHHTTHSVYIVLLRSTSLIKQQFFLELTHLLFHRPASRIPVHFICCLSNNYSFWRVKKISLQCLGDTWRFIFQKKSAFLCTIPSYFPTLFTVLGLCQLVSNIVPQRLRWRRVYECLFRRADCLLWYGFFDHFTQVYL